MRKIIIIGAGFAGLSAAGRLSGSGLDLEISVFDKKETVDFLPLLPDAIGRGLDTQLLACDIRQLLAGKRIKFVREEVLAVELAASRVSTSCLQYSYDFLIIASGSQTNFFANRDAQASAYALNSVSDAEKIIKALKKNTCKNFIICGGGYTGVEAATNLWLFCRRSNVSGNIVIIERSQQILGPLPKWMKDYAQDNLKGMGIEVLFDSTVEGIRENRVEVSGGRVFENAMLIWVPGVRTADFIQAMAVNKNAQGRIAVDEYLKFRQGCFSVGDAALVSFKGAPLRMAVQFSIAEGACAADNVIRDIKGLPLRKFCPLDLGYVIPMANNRSCGRVFGLNLKGFLPTILHFIMCIYRSYNLKNKIRLGLRLVKAVLCRR